MHLEMNNNGLEEMIRRILMEKLEKYGLDGMTGNDEETGLKYRAPSGVTGVKLPAARVRPQDRLDTGKSSDQVYTRDLFSLEESPRLGCGVMEMRETTFSWHLGYDEMDYVIEGTLEIVTGDEVISAKAGELVFIPRGSSIQFQVRDFARFLYVTYPADWQGAE